MNIEEYINTLIDKGLSDNDILISLMSGVYHLAKKNRTDPEKLFQEAASILKTKETTFREFRLHEEL